MGRPVARWLRLLVQEDVSTKYQETGEIHLEDCEHKFSVGLLNK